MNECENIEPDAGGNCLATCATERQVKKLRLFRIGLETAETDWQACDMAETWFGIAADMPQYGEIGRGCAEFV